MEAFLRGKLECLCKKLVCAAMGYKQCPQCFNVLSSVCSRKTCQEDGKKPIMILHYDAQGGSKHTRKRKSETKLFETIVVGESSEDEAESNDSESGMCESVKGGSDGKERNEGNEAESLNMQIGEEDIGMCYASQWFEPRRYRWRKLELVFSDDIASEVNKAKFKFLQRKRLSSDPQEIRYILLQNSVEEIVPLNQVFFGPIQQEEVKSLLMFVCESEVSNITEMLAYIL